MGNTFSQRNAVTVLTEKQVYQDGEVVEGVVCLNLVKPLRVSSIECQLQGLERSDIERESFGTDRTDLGRLDQFLSLCCTLPDTDRQLEPGQYQWCFALALPKGARSTQRVEAPATRRSPFMCGKVEYFVNVYVAKRDKSGRQVPALTHSLPLVVHRRARVAVESIEESIDEAVTRWCCIKEGTIRARALVDRCTYLPGDEVKVKVEVDNQSPRRIEAVQLCVRHMTWLRVTTQLEDHERRHIESLYVAPHEMPVEPFSKQDRMMSVRLPEKLPSTHVGSCFTSKFFVTVTLCMGVTTTDVRVKAPVTVLPPLAHGHELQLPEQPDWWQPQLMGDNQAVKVAGRPDMTARFEWLACKAAEIALDVADAVLG